MKTKHFVVAFDFTEGAEDAFLVLIDDNDIKVYQSIADLITTQKNKNILYKVVSMQEDKYHLVSMTEDGEFTDFWETDTEKDACNTLREEVETRNLYPYDEVTMEDEGRGEENDDESEHIIYGLYGDKDDKRTIYFVVGQTSKTK